MSDCSLCQLAFKSTRLFLDDQLVISFQMCGYVPTFSKIQLCGVSE